MEDELLTSGCLFTIRSGTPLGCILIRLVFNPILLEIWIL